MGIFDLFNKKFDKPSWISDMPKEMRDILLAEINSNPQACNHDEIPEGTGSFGFDNTNPIPVYGIPMNEEYLSKLRLISGERVRWRRIGSIGVKGIDKPVDEYEIFNLNGDTIALLYISPYHLKTSNKAPIGFKIV